MTDAAAHWRDKVGRRLALIGLLMLLNVPLCALAGTMNRTTLELLFPPPLMVGEKSNLLPAWPIFRREAAGPELVNLFQLHSFHIPV